MGNSIAPDLVDAVQERALEKAMSILLPVVQRQMRDDGTTYGDSPLSRGERILRFQDYAERGVLDALRVVKTELLQRMVTQFEKDIRESPFIARHESPAEPRRYP